MRIDPSHESLILSSPTIVYPCWWTYAVVGTDEEELRLAIGEVVAGTEHRVSFSKLSAQKHYASLHVEIYVASEEQRNAFFGAFKDHPKIKYVI